MVLVLLASVYLITLLMYLVFTEKGIINVDVGSSNGTTAVGFNYGKFLETLTPVCNQSVDIETNKPLFKISWHQWQDIMNDTNSPILIIVVGP